jgi:hypothetical protein
VLFIGVSVETEMRFLLWICALSLLSGCAAQRHGSTTYKFSGYVIPVSSRPGSMRLQMERDYDSTVEGFVAGNGDPDYIYVVDRKNLKLIYMASNEVAVFKRVFSSVSKVAVEEGISSDITARLQQLEELAPSAL